MKKLLILLFSILISQNSYSKERVYLTCEFCSDDQCMELDGSQTLIIFPDTNEFLFGPEMRRTLKKYSEFGRSALTPRPKNIQFWSKCANATVTKNMKLKQNTGFFQYLLK